MIKGNISIIGIGMWNVVIALNWLTIQSPPHTALYSIHRFLLREVSETSVTVRVSDSLKSRITVDFIQKIRIR